MIKVGDLIRVKKGVKDPDMPRFNLEGWTGTVMEVIERYEDDRQALIYIKWDEYTKRHKMDREWITESDNQDLEWRYMNLYVNEVDIVNEENLTETSIQKSKHSRPEFGENITYIQ